MRHEKIIKREDGSKVKIEVTFHVSHGDVNWITRASTKARGKKKWLPTKYLYDRNRLEQILEVVTEEELQAICSELWFDVSKKMIPTSENIKKYIRL